MPIYRIVGGALGNQQLWYGPTGTGADTAIDAISSGGHFGSTHDLCTIIPATPESQSSSWKLSDQHDYVPTVATVETSTAGATVSARVTRRALSTDLSTALAATPARLTRRGISTNPGTGAATGYGHVKRSAKSTNTDIAIELDTARIKRRASSANLGLSGLTADANIRPPSTTHYAHSDATANASTIAVLRLISRARVVSSASGSLTAAIAGTFAYSVEIAVSETDAYIGVDWAKLDISVSETSARCWIGV